MAAQAGRKLLVEYSTDSGTTYSSFTGQTTGGLTVNREAIEVTDKDDDGVRALLAELATFSVDVNFEAVMKDTTFAAYLLDAAPTALLDARVTIGGLGTVEGTFQVLNGEITGEDGDNYIGITGNLASSGTVTFTAS